MGRAMKLTPAVRMGVSIALATGLYGISFGALGVASGLTPLQTMCLSLLMFTGGSQFAYIGSIGAGGGPAVLAASLMGLRNAVYGANMNALLRPPGWLKAPMAQVTIDESTATAVAQGDPDEQRRGFWTAGVGVYLTWNLFTALGAVLGNRLGDPRTYGLDGASVAAFIALLWPRLRNRDAVATAVLAALVTAIAVPTLPAGIPLIVAALVTAGMALYRSRGALPDAGGEPGAHPTNAALEENA